MGYKENNIRLDNQYILWYHEAPSPFCCKFILNIHAILVSNLPKMKVVITKQKPKILGELYSMSIVIPGVSSLFLILQEAF